MDKDIRFRKLQSLMYVSITKGSCVCRSGRSPSPLRDGSAHWADQLLLVEGDRGVGRDDSALPLVRGALIELHVERVGTLFARLQGAEVEVATQLRDRGQRLVVADAGAEKRRVGGRARGAVLQVDGRRCDRLTELHVGRDGPGVLDVEGLALGLARLQVAEVEVERAGPAAAVPQVEVQRCRVNGDVALLGGREVRTGRRDDEAGHHCCGDEATTEGREGELLDTVGNHEGPLSVVETTVWMSCVGTFHTETFSRIGARHKSYNILDLIICQQLFVKSFNYLVLVYCYSLLLSPI